MTDTSCSTNRDLVLDDIVCATEDDIICGRLADHMTQSLPMRAKALADADGLARWRREHKLMITLMRGRESGHWRSSASIACKPAKLTILIAGLRKAERPCTDLPS